MGSSYILKEVT